MIDSWIQKRHVDELLAECEIQDEVSAIQLLQGCNKELAHHEKGSSSLFDLSHNNYNNDEDEVQKPGNYSTVNYTIILFYLQLLYMAKHVIKLLAYLPYFYLLTTMLCKYAKRLKRYCKVIELKFMKICC